MSDGARRASGTRRKYRRDGEDAEIARRVRWLRVQRGMSQTTLAKTLGVSFQQVQKYEKGVNRISAGRLLKMARALEAPIAYFCAGSKSGRMPIPSPITSSCFSQRRQLG